jgi:long-chain acyl-CoA synthetase
VRISHGNIVAAVNTGFDIINLRPNEDVLNIGAYTHIATLMEFLVTKAKGFTVSYLTREPDDPDVLEDEIRKLRERGVRVKALMAVPKFWIYLLKELLEELKGKPVLRELGEKILAIEKNGRLQNLGMIDKAKLTATRLLLREKLGGHFSYGISSSSKLDPALVEIFGKLGITVLDIYGSTECTGIIARSRLNEIHPGTSGRVLPSLEWRLAQPRLLPGWAEPVGLLEVRGPTVAAGYLGAGGTTEPLTLTPDGWLATGDLAWVDDQACVRLVGREKELIPWMGGWLLDPQHLSNLVTRSIAVKDAMVVHAHPADPRLSVYVFPDWPRIRDDVRWRRDIAAGLSEDQALKPHLVEAIRYAASLLAIPAELDTDRIWILPRKLERTPTHKIKYLVERSRLHEARAI